ncbi:DNA translocase FtsK 4TM domain-containing protein [Rickettsiales bacterium]|nr:DNA translocase FtsK 4TM domain-containing protein [Rickettsiales bacterium]
MSKYKKSKSLRILTFLFLFTLSFLTLVGLISFDINDNSFFQNDSSIKINNNFLGSFGSYSSDLLFRALGINAYLIPFIFILWTLKVFIQKDYIHWVSVSLFPIFLIFASFFSTFWLKPEIQILPFGSYGFVGNGLKQMYSFHFNEFPVVYIKVFLSFISVILLLITSSLSLRSWKLVLSVISLFLKSIIFFILRINKRFRFPKLDQLTNKRNRVISSKKIRPILRKKSVNENYSFPILDYLEKPVNQNSFETENTRNTQKNTVMLANVLNDFNINGQITSVKQGPIVTLYELTPAPGTKTSTVIGLADDIARSMSALSTRISAIPGRDAIGIEIPNKQRETVFLRELIDNNIFNSTSHSLPLVLGKDILGNPIIVDLSNMPHLLVAGTTGSGKSVGINAMILSLLYNLTPEDCRLILIDPKMLELSVYQDIPHLLTEVVTDPKKAVTALKWTVKEMEARYHLMSQIGVREIEAYNDKVKKILDKGEILQKEVQVGFDPETGKPINEKKPIELRLFPKIVVVVDELADLMITAGKEIEAAIQRLSQMARAAGIHLIVATQRPSVDVITGTIKSNFPSRISYQVTTKIDSRTILGEQGGEKLLGKGDLLITMVGKRLLRVHGPFVKTHEVESVVNHLKSQGEPEYLESITHEEESDSFVGLNLDKGDELYNQAVAIVCREKKASTSFIQRHLQIGYNRAARIIEKMETEGIVSAANHVGRREVLVGRNS